MLKLSRRIENAGVQHQEDATVHESEAVFEDDPVCEHMAFPHRVLPCGISLIYSDSKNRRLSSVQLNPTRYS